MLTVTYDPTDTTIRMFTDGDEGVGAVLDLSTLPVPAAELSIGGRDTENSISGMIDEVMLYSYALTPGASCSALHRCRNRCIHMRGR